MLRFAKVSVVCLFVTALLVLAWGPGSASSQDKPKSSADPAAPPVAKDVQAKADKALNAGAKFLLAAQQPDGSWGGKYGPAMTALVVKAVVDAGQPADSPALKKAIDFVVSQQIADDSKMKGSFSAKELANYNTAICLSMLVAVNKGYKAKFDPQIKAGLDFLRRDQWDEGEGLKPDDKPANVGYGGFGYGGGQRPDMSNTNTTMDALKALKDAGYLKEDDEMFKKVQVFISHSQNRQESNKADTFSVGADGGFIYTPAQSPVQGGPQSKAGATSAPDGRSKLISYGSMTYAGFKSFLYSGLSKDDPRVVAASKWIRNNYTLSENPGVGAEGMFYYYHTMARALAAGGEATIKDKANVAHDWR
ncbi:MAG: terpene cyclase/mutase family protein, partial [Phycisphaerae bacterium]|nr:terpene cyclase/mutase family protein [Phycisphaerae bacterium]